jgi:hypothetical protein
MNRAYVEDAVERVVRAGQREGFRVVPSIGDPLSPIDLENLTASSDIRLPIDYANFLQSANGLRIDFYLCRIPENLYPAWTFQITGLPEALALTGAWRREIADYIHEEEDPPERVLSERERELIAVLVLINPVSQLFIHPETRHVYTEDRFYLFKEGFLTQVATSFDDLFKQSIEIMLRDGHAQHSW